MTSARAPHPSALAIPPGDLWVFGYGSLLWNPGFPFRSWAPALIFGYHRALCIASHRWRGTPERPGLVLGLERGGACRGIAFRVARRDVTITLDALWAREMRGHVYRPRLLRKRLPDREVRALAFIADPAHTGYAEPRPDGDAPRAPRFPRRGAAADPSSSGLCRPRCRRESERARTVRWIHCYNLRSKLARQSLRIDSIRRGKSGLHRVG